MKEKIIWFIVGLLLGAIISTASIYVYTLSQNNTNTTSNNATQNTMDNRGTPPEMPSGNNQGGMSENNTNTQGTNA